MHSSHRYLLRTLSDVHPGDRISLDPGAIAAVIDDRPQDIDWGQVDQDARQVLERTRPTPTHLILDVRTPDGRAVIEGGTLATLLVAKPANDY